ncbi:hypothetical protein [Actinoalloteichus caeruleus]|uniref:Uncharacterized protein n=1 Tax=Actinoalloteichus caeruleus DSM 43889 TaxID=1120930 RepID=A0ABT1JCI9_ACTCY|nr:hypothetical protein [Actinoalloteichus caeruleus]MCP2330202.1 hypothetical protein [Actinoalloteichus caeruleus DSM 43889]
MTRHGGDGGWDSSRTASPAWSPDRTWHWLDAVPCDVDGAHLDARERMRRERRAHAHPGSCFGVVAAVPGGRDGENAHLVARRGVLVSTADAFSTATLAPDALRLALGAPPWTDLVAAPAVVRGTVAG